MRYNYTVRQGDCALSIAARHGVSWNDIWNHASNQELSNKRSPNVLKPGDVVSVPSPPDERAFHVGTSQKHRFRSRQSMVKLRLHLLSTKDTVHAGVKYTLRLGDAELVGSTDNNGYLDQDIPATATHAKLVLHLKLGDEELELLMGALDPLETISGIQGRLSHLGYNISDISGTITEETHDAIYDFQEDNELEVSGNIDEPTLQRLRQLHSE